MSDSPDPRATLSAEPSHAAANLTRKGTFKSPVRALITASEPTPLPPTGTTQRKSVKKKAPTLPSAKVPAASAMALYFARTPVFGRLPNRGFRAHTATVLGTELFLFGGCDKVCYRDVWKLDLDSGFWTKPPISPLAQEKLYPPPCRAHTMTRVGTRLVCFGGGDAGLYYNSTWVFNTHTLTWSKPQVFGEVPSARRAHAAVLYKTKIYVFGGGNGERALNDLFSLDVSDSAFDRLTWTQIRTTGDRPGQRGYHTLDLVKNQAVLFGGSDGGSCFHDVYLLDLETFVWTKLPIVNPRPEFARLSHSSVVLGSYIYFLFGHNGQEYVKDVIALNLVTLQFEVKPVAGVPPAARGYATVNLYDNRIFCIGGYDGKIVYDDIFTLELGANAYQQQIANFEVGSGL